MVFSLCGGCDVGCGGATGCGRGCLDAVSGGVAGAEGHVVALLGPWLAEGATHVPGSDDGEFHVGFSFVRARRCRAQDSAGLQDLLGGAECGAAAGGRNLTRVWLARTEPEWDGVLHLLGAGVRWPYG